jgi:NAD+ synthase (glutamine-hydrolysing)
MLRLCLAQLNMRVGDFPGNTDKIIKGISEAEKGGADIAVFPELALCGYPPEDLLYQKMFVKTAAKYLKTIAGKTKRCSALVGYPCYTQEGTYNSAALLDRGKVTEVYHKVLLPNYSVFDEKRYFKPGRSGLLFSLNQCRVGVTVCEDVWMTGGPVNALLDAGIHLLVNISASPYYRGKTRQREKKLAALARGAGISVAYCNLVGAQDELVFDGGSLIVSGKGKVIGRAKQFREDLLFCDIEISKGSKRSIGFGDIPVRKVKVKDRTAAKGQVKRKAEKSLGPVEEVFSALVLGLQDYAFKNGFKRSVLGISGGIDSALVAAIAADALGPDNVLGLSMPSVYSSAGTQSDARTLAGKLGIRFREIPVQTLFEGFKDAVAADFKGLKEDEAEENLQARIRANLLMTYSNKFNMLLLNTGNKSEASVGYCTLYGDMAGGFAPIKDVSKTLVYDLAAYYNGRQEKAVIPESILIREPTAELKSGQKDSDALPPYPELDRILYLHIEKHLDADGIVKHGFKQKTVLDVLAKIKKSEYKRRQAPPGIKITPLALGKDRRMPISNYF